MTAPVQRSRRADFLPGAATIALHYPAEVRVDWPGRLAAFGLVAAFFGSLGLALSLLDIDWSRFLSGFQRLGWFIRVMMPPEWGSAANVATYFKALAETVAMAFLGTSTAVLLALPFAFVCARNVMPNPLLRFAVRRLLDAVRSVDALIWALIWISVVGLGPFAGVLALATADFGILGKMFCEVIEGADDKAATAVTAVGGGPMLRLRFGLLPDVLPVLTGQILYQIEANIRGAAILGVVGAGGIGAYLQEQIRINEWHHVSFLTLMLLLTVIVIDHLSAFIRRSLTGRR
jgi:phosphonate transport system permease protein